MSDISRRQVLSLAAAGAATVMADSLFGLQSVSAYEKAVDEFTLPPLPYAYDALVPSIDEKTMTIHHDKHHQGYVNGLNAAIKEAPELKGKSLNELLWNIDSVPEAVRQKVINMGGGHSNHSLFWIIMSPQGGGEPTGKLAEAIKGEFESFAKFREGFSGAAGKVFGSGWAWLVVDDGKLAVVSTANQDSPLMSHQVPILGLDVWEHAYYLHYQNRRPDYIGAWFNVVNWQEVGKRYEMAMK